VEECWRGMFPIKHRGAVEKRTRREMDVDRG